MPANPDHRVTDVYALPGEARASLAGQQYRVFRSDTWCGVAFDIFDIGEVYSRRRVYRSGEKGDRYTIARSGPRNHSDDQRWRLVARAVDRAGVLPKNLT